MQYKDLPGFKKQIRAAGFEFVEARPTSHRSILGRDYGAQIRRSEDDPIIFVKNADDLARAKGGIR